MTAEMIKKVHGGFQVDGLDLLRANCGCGGLTGPGGDGVGDCCMTYSTVKQDDHTVAFFAKATTPNTTDNFEWGYRVKKGDVEVDVLVYDTRSPKKFTFGGKYPPSASDWQKKGWEVLSQFEATAGGNRCQAARLVSKRRILRTAGHRTGVPPRGPAPEISLGWPTQGYPV